MKTIRIARTLNSSDRRRERDISEVSSITLTCAQCETTWDAQATNRATADSDPGVRVAILSDRLDVVACPSCGQEARVEPRLMYLDVALGLWIAAYPLRDIGQCDVLEQEAQTLFAATYGAGAGNAAREVGAGLQPRVTFGWPALREKLLLAQHGLDDVTAEMLKLDLLRRLPSAPLRPGVELRVVDVVDEMLRLVWIDPQSEAVLQAFETEMRALEDIENAAADWADVRESVAAGLFVDMQRLLLAQE